MAKNLESVNENLITTFLSAFQNMVSAGNSQEKVEAIKFKDSKLIIHLVTAPFNLYFIGRVNMKEKDKNSRKILNKLSDIFVQDFWKYLENWTGDISLFDAFSKHLEDLN
ncbi:MAG: hypothetical protein GY870_07935 [archaeon]|nr:hypothetical protein [archaeon]